MSDELEKRKEEAQQVINMLQENAKRKTDIEEAKEGLVIIEAIYGKLDTDLVMHATIPIQALVNQSQLHIIAGIPKSELVGFYDAAYKETKKLRIKYKFQGRLHQVEVGDEVAVDLPQLSHLLVAETNP